MLIDNKTAKGAIFLIISAFCFALMGLFVQLSGDLPSLQKAFFRNIVALVITIFSIAAGII